MNIIKNITTILLLVYLVLPIAAVGVVVAYPDDAIKIADRVSAYVLRQQVGNAFPGFKF